MEVDVRMVDGWAVRDATDPVLRTGDVLVDVVAAPVTVHATGVFAGACPTEPVARVTIGSGAIARVRALGAEGTKLAIGDWVYCDPTLRSRDEATHGDDGGGLADFMIVPADNAVRVGEIEGAEAERWCALGSLLVPYGALLAAAFQPGETVLISDATGHLGGAAVAVALAMGARRVVATGRDEEVLDDLECRFGTRIRPVRVTGSEDEDRAQILATAGAVDCAIDVLTPAANVAMTRTAALSVRPHGRIVLMGGIDQDQDLALPYRYLMRNNITVRGQWMYPPDAPGRMIGLVRAGLVDLRQFRVDAFPVRQAANAVEHARRTAGAFRLTVLRPD